MSHLPIPRTAACQVFNTWKQLAAFTRKTQLSPAKSQNRLSEFSAVFKNHGQSITMPTPKMYTHSEKLTPQLYSSVAVKNHHPQTLQQNFKIVHPLPPPPPHHHPTPHLVLVWLVGSFSNDSTFSCLALYALGEHTVTAGSIFTFIIEHPINHIYSWSSWWFLSFHLAFYCFSKQWNPSKNTPYPILSSITTGLQP